MKHIQTEELKDWISPYLTVTAKRLDVLKSLKQKNILKYFQELTLPNIFEKYAIILHSFWVYNLPENEIKQINIKVDENLNCDCEFPEDDYNAVNWMDFYDTKNFDFDLANAVKNNVDGKFPFKQMNNELYPGAGILDKKHLSEISRTALKLYGNQEIETYYIFLATNNWEEDKMYRLKISELMELIENEETEKTPSLIYSTDKKWAINSDYDLEFSIIGGEKKFIESLTEKHPHEIYSIT